MECSSSEGKDYALRRREMLMKGFLIRFVSCMLLFGTAQHVSGQSLEIATFDVDATPPLGFPMAYDPVKRLDELTLRCRGIVLRLGLARPPPPDCLVRYRLDRGRQ
jgi:hypothetical protein